RLPLYSWVPPGVLSDQRLLSVSLPLIVSNPGPRPSPRARPQRWALDTRFTGEAYAWRHHLREAGLDPRPLRSGSAFLAPVGGPPLEFPVRSADLWLVSNIPSLRGIPYRIRLNRGVAFRNVPSLPNPESNCPLLGMRALERSGLHVGIDFGTQTV